VCKKVDLGTDYTAASKMSLGLLINFGHSVKIKLKILTKDGEMDEKKAVSLE